METPKDEIVQDTVAKANEVLKDPEVTKKAKKAVKKSAAKHVAKEPEVLAIGPKQYDFVVLPEDENDPHWDPKLRNPVPEGLVDGLAEFGWDESSQAVAIREGSKIKIIHGKTRWRAIEKANKIRAKNKLDPIVAWVRVEDEDPGDDAAILTNMRRNVRLNRHVQEIDPMTLAESITRALSAGLEEKQVAQDHAVTVNDLHGYLLLTDEDKCPPKVQELLREGKISFAAALELARRADKMTKGELTAAAENVAKVAAGGIKITAAQVKKAAGVGDEHPATQKERKQFILDLHSGKLAGKMGDAVKWAAIIATEVGLGSRSVDGAWEALDKIAKGHTVRVDFKQYQDGNKAEPVKGQEKK